MAERIASLLPSATEIACALGLADRLVGVSHECDYPTHVRSLPKLTSSILAHGLSPAQIDAAVSAACLEQRPLYAVDGQQLTALEPDLILTQGVCAVCAVTPNEVEQGLSFARVEQRCDAPVLSLSAVNLAGILRDIHQVGLAAGVPERAESLISELTQRWEAIQPVPHPPKVLMLEWPDPPWVGGHWVPEQVSQAGGIDCFGQPGAPSERLDWERVQAVDPDVIVVMACGFTLEQNAQAIASLQDRPGWAELRAVKAAQVWAADANSLYSRPGPRAVLGAEVLNAILAGRPVDPLHARRIGE